MIASIKKEDCTGCKGCGDVCPEKAIIFPVDSEGFWYPSVDDNKCSKCGLCIKRCPNLNQSVYNKDEPKVYAAWSLDPRLRLKSTSGGIYSEFAKGMLAEGGYIAGCVFTDDYKSAKHIVGNTGQDLDKIMRSKYFQSDTAGIYKSVKDLLEKGEKVLFCGSPCQSAALSLYLGKEYADLIQCDYVCHGINSPMAHQKHLEELENKYGAPAQFVNFKNKKQGWRALGLYIKFKNGRVYFTNRTNSPWTNGYIVGNLYLRPSCYNCGFKTIPRISDISIADFWGLRKNKRDMFNGISLVMINSKKGAGLYEKINPYIYSEPSTLEQAVKGNGSILNSAPYDNRREEFFSRINNNEKFSSVVWDLTALGPFKRLKNGLYFKLKMLMGR
jgi:coenzyme F420-reducing hydrogenase beta subunit